MIAAKFPEANAVLGSSQEEYEPIPVKRFDGTEGRIAMCFRLSPAELEEIARTKTLWVQQLTFGRPFQPIALSTQRPDDLPECREVIGVYIIRYGEKFELLIDYGDGPGILGTDGRIRCAGQHWVTMQSAPRRLSRYRREVRPVPPSRELHLKKTMGG